MPSLSLRVQIPQVHSLALNTTDKGNYLRDEWVHVLRELVAVADIPDVEFAVSVADVPVALKPLPWPVWGPSWVR